MLRNNRTQAYVVLWKHQIVSYVYDYVSDVLDIFKNCNETKPTSKTRICQLSQFQQLIKSLLS